MYIGKTPTAVPLTSSDITDGIISTDKLAANAVVTSKISDGTIATADIANVNVTQGKIADQSINEAKMQISNAPSNGYMLTAQSGNTGGLTWAEAAGGAYTKISETTLGSAAAQMDFTSLSNSFHEFMFVLDNFKASGDAKDLLIFFERGGSFVTSGYKMVVSRFDSSGGSAIQSANGTTTPQLSTSIGNGSGENLSGVVRIANHDNNSNVTHAYSHLAFQDAGGDSTVSIGNVLLPYDSSTNYVTGIRLKYNAGNIAAGARVTLIGLN